MAHTDPKEEIIAHLSAVRIAPNGSDGSRSVDSTASKARKTFHFLKDQHQAKRQVFAVTMQENEFYEACFLCDLTKDVNGKWHIQDSLGLSQPQRTIERKQPWANLTGSGWPNQFFAGGYVLDDSQQTVQRLRLVSANGVVMEDRVKDGLVLFLTEQKVVLPFHVYLYNQANELVNSHHLFPQ
ncbi:hypothetical protein [Tengunoibacter tsumagoiensis]|uniref:Uncharacterized protein n=1 Tax=Tengunoibacter tsumagoiensis TaxID=2014871 RepID=A0A401ZYD0_9CHLR|nr:hypothetical protein [Tengunoibacter tsumagoiensis]GCE11847.1 hypothetical protein KTT_17060 [Tengunoibacter tsumagoiensis]